MNLDSAITCALSIHELFGEDCGNRLDEVADAVGLDIREVDADSFDGTLVRAIGYPRGTVLINQNIREKGRKKFTLAHEIGHYILPRHQMETLPCKRSDISDWRSSVKASEAEANRFAAELLMPSKLVRQLIPDEPKLADIDSIADRFGCTLSAAAYRIVELSSHRVAAVWSVAGVARWYVTSPEFQRKVRVGPLSVDSLAADCFSSGSTTVAPSLTWIPAESWLYDYNLSADARLLEQTRCLPNYNAALSLIILRERIEERLEDDEEDTSLDPLDFTLQRRRWPR